MMEFKYVIQEVPDSFADYRLYAYVEGDLRVVIDDEVVVGVEGALLVEFALVLHRWLWGAGASDADLYYASMDFEEEPVLAFRRAAEGSGYFVDSAWLKSMKRRVPREQIVVAAEQYLKLLSREMMSRFRVNLEEGLRSGG